jgi:hypothetical protein
MRLRFAIDRISDTRARNVDFIRPALTLEKQRTSTLTAKAAARSR